MDDGKLVQLTTKVRNNLDCYKAQIKAKDCPEGRNSQVGKKERKKERC